MQNPVVVGLCGLAGSGKSTLAQHLKLHHEFVILPFAAPLKRMLGALGVPDENLYGQKKEEPLDLLCGKSARQALQWLGTEWGREMIGQSVWKNAWLAEARKHKRVVADDVRFPNEVRAIRDMDGIVIEVMRPGLPVSALPHASEVAIKPEDVDRFLVNQSGTKSKTFQSLDAVIGSAFGIKCDQGSLSLFEDAAE